MPNRSIAAALLCGGLCTQAPLSAQVKAIPAADVETQLTCEEAAAGFTEINSGAKPERVLAIMAALNECGAAAYNKAQVANGSDMRAIPTGRIEGDGDQKKVVFNLVTLDSRNEQSIRQVCSAGAAFVGMAAGEGDPLVTTIATAAGDVSCGSYIDALMKSDNLLLIAPTLLPGITMTKEVLTRVGIPQKEIDRAEAFVRRVAGDAATGGVRTGVAVATGGMVTVDKDLRCARVFGKKVCR